ncbi:MAG TPA: hypothetical protein PKI19_08405, partial [Elusimicrobiales bacterium]|nr:hypothetical protein [Elusimicrobiales bacterium]
LRAAAAAAGFEAMLVCEDAVPVPPIAVKPVKIEFKGSGFDFTAGLIEFIPYEAVTIFSAGVFDAPVQPLNTDALRDNVFFKLRSRLPGPPPLPEPRTAKETFFRADLIADGGRLRLLLEPENLDFSALGAERSHSSLVNFRTLLGKLAAPTFNAVKNGLLAAFLAGQPLANLKFASAAACDAELSRLLLIKTGR